MTTLRELIDLCVAHPQGLFFDPYEAKWLCQDWKRLQEEMKRLEKELTWWRTVSSIDVLREDNVALLARAEAAETDTARLDWLTRQISGAELRRIGVVWPAWSAEYSRNAIDAAIKQKEEQNADLSEMR